jgi:hypothetical protein
MLHAANARGATIRPNLLATRRLEGSHRQAHGSVAPKAQLPVSAANANGLTDGHAWCNHGYEFSETELSLKFEPFCVIIS